VYAQNTGTEVESLLDSNAVHSKEAANRGGGIALSSKIGAALTPESENNQIGSNDAGICGEEISVGQYTRIAPYVDFEGDERPDQPLLLECDVGADEYVVPEARATALAAASFATLALLRRSRPTTRSR